MILIYIYIYIVDSLYIIDIFVPTLAMGFCGWSNGFRQQIQDGGRQPFVKC